MHGAHDHQIRFVAWASALIWPKVARMLGQIEGNLSLRQGTSAPRARGSCRRIVLVWTT